MFLSYLVFGTVAMIPGLMCVFIGALKGGPVLPVRSALGVCHLVSATRLWPVPCNFGVGASGRCRPGLAPGLSGLVEECPGCFESKLLLASPRAAPSP